MGHFVGGLLATQHRAGAFANANGVAAAVGVEAKDLLALRQDLVVGDEAGTYINDVDVVDDFLRSRDGFEVFALGDDRAHHARVVFIRDGFQQYVRGHDRDAEAAHTVGLHGETAFAVHALNDGLDGRAGLHSLVGGQVANVARTHGEHFLAQQRVLLVHHLLENSGSVNARNVVVFKGRHKRHGTRGHHKMLGIDIADFLCHNVLQCDALAFEQIPNGVVEQNAFVVVAGKGLGDVEAAHSTEFLLFFEEEKLVRLHIELSADVGVVIDDHVGNAEFAEFLAAGQSRRTRADDGDGGLVDFHLALRVLGRLGLVVFGDFAHFLHAIDEGDADAADFAVHEHFARAALADAALEAAVAASDAVAMDGIARLVKGGGDGLAPLTAHGLAFILEFHKVSLRDVQDGMFLDFVH